MAREDDLEGLTHFTLTHADRQSGTWARLRDHFAERLDTLRKQNDGALDPIQTATLRGQIKTFDALLRLDREDPPVED